MLDLSQRPSWTRRRFLFHLYNKITILLEVKFVIVLCMYMINHYFKYNAMEKWTRVHSWEINTVLFKVHCHIAFGRLSLNKMTWSSTLTFGFTESMFFVTTQYWEKTLFSTQYFRIQETIYKMLDNFTKSLYVNTEKGFVYWSLLIKQKDLHL